MQRLASSSLARCVRRNPFSLSYSAVRPLHWHVSNPKTTFRPTFKAHNALVLGRLKTRQYSDEAQARILQEGLPLQNSGPTTASLLAYAATHWLAPSVIPPGWSADWRRWDYLLTLFAFSPYFLRLPQIEMLVNVKYGIPGEVRPIMYSDARQSVLFSTELQPQKPGSEQDGDGAGYVFLLNCRTFEVWTYDPRRGSRHVPDTIEGLVLLVGAAPTPEAVPMVKVRPDSAGEAALQRILDRDPTVVPLLEQKFLGYAPRPTEREKELVNPDEADAAHKKKFAEAIRQLCSYVERAEKELKLDEAELGDLRDGSPELQESFRQDEEGHAQIRAAIQDTKKKLMEWQKLWVERYGPWDG